MGIQETGDSRASRALRRLRRSLHAPPDETADALNAEFQLRTSSIRWLAGSLTGLGVGLGFGSQLLTDPDLGLPSWTGALVADSLLLVASGVLLTFRVLTTSEPTDLSPHAKAIIKHRLPLACDFAVNQMLEEVRKQTEGNSRGADLAAALREQPSNQELKEADLSCWLRKWDSNIKVCINRAIADMKSNQSDDGDVTGRQLDAVEADIAQARAWLRDRTLRRRCAAAWVPTLLIPVAGLAMLLVVAGAPLAAAARSVPLSGDLGPSLSTWLTDHTAAPVGAPMRGLVVMSNADREMLKSRILAAGASLPYSCELPPAHSLVHVTAHSGDVDAEGRLRHARVRAEVPGCPFVTIESNAQLLAPLEGADSAPTPVRAFLSQEDAGRVVERRGEATPAMCKPKPGTSVPAILLSGTLDHPVDLEILGMVRTEKDGKHLACRTVVLRLTEGGWSSVLPRK